MNYKYYNKKAGLLPYIGGKLMIGQYIIPFIPNSYGYSEPFCGMASVGMLLKPRKQEFYNDIDDRVTAFFNCLRDENKFDLLKEELLLSCNSEKNFRECMEPVTNGDEIEKARRFVILKMESFSAKEDGWAGVSFTGDNKRLNNRHFGKLDYLQRYFKSWYEISQRLKHVRFYNMDAISFINRVNYENMTIYCDPPYPNYVTVNKKYYKSENHDEYHEKLASVLNDFKGNAIISSFDNPVYDELYSGWTKINVIERTLTVDIKETSSKSEVIYVNTDEIKSYNSRNKIKSSWLSGI